MKKSLVIVFAFSVLLFSQTQTLLYEDFEDGLTGWTAKNLVDSTAPTLWRITNTRSVSPVHSAAWNDSSSNTYPGGRYDALDSPPVTIPHNARTFLKFKAFIHLTLNGTYYHDYFFVKYSTNNGATWNNFLPYAVSGQVLAWRSFPEDFGPTASSELTYWAGKTMIFRILTASDTLNPNGLGVFLDDFHVYTQSCEFVDPNEPNNTLSTATPAEYGDIFHVSFCPQNDDDYYKFTAQAGDQLNIVTQHNMPYTYLYLQNSNGFTLKYAYNEMTYNVTQSGTYYLKATGYYNYSANYSIYFNSRPEPDIISVTDIPADQGLKVRVRWQASFYDPQNGTGQIKEYQLWRKVNDSLETKNIKNTLPGNPASEYWEHIATIPALSNRPFVNYTYVSPTLEDNMLTTFRIAALPKNENQPVTWGLEGSGFSIDNLSPGFNNVSASASENGIMINWQVNPGHPDIQSVEIYKGIFELFPPLPEYKIAQVPYTQNSFLDDQLLSGYEYYYIAGIKDRSGNISYSSAVTPGSLTGIAEEKFIPAEFSLKQNYPNPFNPSTIIEFNIPSASMITLKIYDIIGREVAELANGFYTPGKYMITFNASGLSSGIYFYTLGSGSYQETKKLILMR